MLLNDLPVWGQGLLNTACSMNSCRLRSPFPPTPPTHKRNNNPESTEPQALDKQVWAAELLRQTAPFLSFQPGQLSDRHTHKILPPPPKITRGLPVCRDGNRNWKITMSSPAAL